MFAWSGDVDPKEQVRKWKQSMRGEQRKVDRQIRDIQREEAKVKRSIKDAAKRGHDSECKMLAKEIVRARKVQTRLHTSKAHMNSVVMQMENQLAQQKLTGHVAKSTEIMKMMNKLTKVSQIAEVMQGMQKEMCKAGVIEEMVDDAFEMMEDQNEEEADEEVERVMTELAADATSGMQSAPTQQPAAQQEQAADEEEEEDMELMRSRLAQLKG